jgi:lipoxygenase homology domain-containing protein 1
MGVPSTAIVQTGTVSSAETDANIWMKIYSENGNSGSRFLDNTDDDFKNSQTAKFDIGTRDLGDLKSIYIWPDSAGYKPG